MTSNSDSANPRPRFAWASIAQGARNHGNVLIEYSVRRAFDLGVERIAFDSFQPMRPAVIEQINRECDLLVSPGCTTLQVGQNVGYDAFDQINVPKPCMGGCLWQAGHTSHAAMLARMATPAWLTRPLRRAGDVNLAVARKHTTPVGTRDPFTQRALTEGGIEAMFVGCPTLLADAPIEYWKPVRGRRLIVSLSRFSLPTQLALVERLRRRWAVSLLMHETYERKFAKLFRGVRVVEFESAEQYMNEYREADLVLTGRLHGALPAIRHGTPVTFYGDSADTRFSLLSHLGLPLHRLDATLEDRVADLAKQTPRNEILTRAYALRESFAAYARRFGIGVRMGM